MKSIQKMTETTLVINKSEFINYLIPVNSIEEANLYLEDIREKHPNANHYCFAYIIGMNQEVQKYNDDGEPSRTAGMPMMEVLQKNELTNVLNISVRYFGGIKLGAGGLVRAYTKSCSEGILASEFAYLTKLSKIKISVPFDEIGHVEKHIRDNYKLYDTVYDHQVNYYVELLESERETLQNKMIENTKGKASFELIKTFTLFR